MKAVYTIGAAAEKIHTHIEGAVPIVSAGTLEEAMARAGAAAQPGEIVLLAPACSSFDQFENYEHRGRVFKERRVLAALSGRAERRRTGSYGRLVKDRL